MALTGTQMGLCFSSYWYMWLTNFLSGLLFIGLDIGVAAFFMKKFGNQKKKPSNYERPESGGKRPLSAVNVPITDDADANSTFVPAVAPISSASRSISSDDATSLGENDDFAYATLQAVNRARNQYKARPVELDEQLSIIAQRWASQMARTGKLEHSPVELRHYGRQTLGENFAGFHKIEITGERMVKHWLKEAKKYNFGSDGKQPTENFTQLVWQSTQQIGIGRAKSDDGLWSYGVVVFNPPGNIPGRFSTEVLLP